MRVMLRSLFALLIGLAFQPAQAADHPLLFSFEAASSQLGLTRMREAQYADRAAFTVKVKDELLADIFRTVGVDPAKVRTEMTPGGYLLRTNSSLQSRAVVDWRQADRVAAALGYVFRQSSVLVSDLADAKGGTGLAVVRFPRGTLTAAMAHGFFEHAAKVHKGLGGGYTAFGDEMIFLNVRDDAGKPYSELDDKAFAGGLREAAKTFKDGRARLVRVGQAKARFVGNSWRQKPNGEDYVALLGGAADPAVVRLKPIQDRHTAMIMDAAERWGWK
ncbi:MAG: hypothetical protein EXQ95_10380 [Alphaproteobacteria bacterium]|nr:hypothetical protein [Alphaproteobacteria bacterium]